MSDLEISMGIPVGALTTAPRSRPLATSGCPVAHTAVHPDEFVVSAQPRVAPETTSPNGSGTTSGCPMNFDLDVDESAAGGDGHDVPASFDASLVTNSFKRLTPKADWVSKYFYAHLFKHHPEVRGMFAPDMSMQRDRLLHSLVHIVGNIEKADRLEPYLQRLGKQHAAELGVKPEHYPAVGDSLIATLRFLHGKMWTEELEASWTAAYGVIAQIMLTDA